MKAPLSWLKRYVDIDSSPEHIQEMMTSRGIEISSVEYLGEDIQNVVVGKILKIEKHPDADKLVVCQVDANKDYILQIVTGATNLTEGDLVPVALHGSMLPGGVKIKKGKLRGMNSEGMLCSGAELNLGVNDYPGVNEDGILVLQENYDLGMDIKDALCLSDVVFECEPTPNRPDCLSIIGISREIAAATGKHLLIPNTEYEKCDTSITDHVKITVIDTKLCPRYAARTVKNIVIEPSPMYMQRFLRAAGMRPINNIVDITNFVMLETGQPMHAFDLACVGDEHIVVRRATEGEKVVTLDSKEHNLTIDTLLIADPYKAVGIAGIMGGENSEITANTKTALFESAKFNGANIRRNSKAMGIASEAASRFIKGIDIETTEYALERACALVVELKAGEVEQGIIDVCDAEMLKRKNISVRPEKVNKLISLELPAEDMCDILNNLDILASEEDGLIKVEIPHFRDDIEGEADIAEEVARSYGYDKIPITLMKGDLARGKLSRKQMLRDRVRQIAYTQGCYEAITYSFTGNYAYDKLGLSESNPLRNSVRLMNPFGEDNALMRTTAAASMLNVVATNANRRLKGMRFFEITNVHTPNPDPNEVPFEEEVICIACYGDVENFYTIKGIVENIVMGEEIFDVRYVEGAEEYFHPGRNAVVMSGDVVLGQLGEVHPDVCANFDIPGKVYLAELKTKALGECSSPHKMFQPLPRFPAIDRDLAITVRRDIKWEQIRDIVVDKGGSLLEFVRVFDVYEGDHISKGYKSIAFSMSFRSAEKTLTDDEVNEKIQAILLALSEKLFAQLRA